MLAGWRASPARFREDANAEDDLALGGYRDRLVVELAQNAADAGGPAVAFSWVGSRLSVRNTGAPLDAAGVSALATLRASAKRGGRTVGRFGVGFAATAAVSDDVVVASRSGAVRFSRELTAELVSGCPELTAELAARAGRVPLLRLPFPAEDLPADGWDTEVLVEVRADCRERVQALLSSLDPSLLLVLPGLAELTVEGRTVRAVADGSGVVEVDGTSWLVRTADGHLPAELLAGRPVEERDGDRWVVTWALPLPPDGTGLTAGPALVLPGTVPAVVRAPTATDDPMSVPAVLAASLPLGPDRRRVQPGPLTEVVLGHAAAALADLLCGLDPSPSLLSLVPTGFAAGEIDALLAAALLRALRVAPFLPGSLVASAVVVLDDATPDLVARLGDVVGGLLPFAWSSRRHAPALSALGVRRLGTAELTELLAGVDRPPSWWRDLYAALPADVDALGALPVPLADGRMAPGPRGLLLADEALLAEGAGVQDASGTGSQGPRGLAALGLQVVHPDGAHPLLLRLGALPAEPLALLADPRVRAAVENARDVARDDPDDRGLEPVAQAVLALVAAADLRPGELPWLAALPLPATSGDWVPAGDLLLPDGPLAQVVDREAGFGVVRPGVAHEDVLAAVGVLRGFAVVPADEADGVDAVEEWLGQLAPGEEAGSVVRDLDLVRDDAWPAALALLAEADLMRLPYVSWWLARHSTAGAPRPRDLREAGSDPLLVGLFDEAPPGLPGARTSLAEVVADDPALLLARLVTRPVGRSQLRAVYAALAQAEPDVEPPDVVAAVAEGRVQVVPAHDVVVVDRPDLVTRVAPYAVVPCPLPLADALADLLDVALASEVVPAATISGHPEPWASYLPRGFPLPAGQVVVHATLAAPGAGGELVPVDWVADGDLDHVTGPVGLAQAAAWRIGQWDRRHELLAALQDAADPAHADLDG